LHPGLHLPLGAAGRGRYIYAMSGAVAALLIVAMLATLAMLFAGIFSMARGGAFNRRYGNLFMRWRVALQATAIILFILLVLALGR
jgi:hypothetical protein